MDLIHDPARGQVEQRGDMKVEHLRLLLDYSRCFDKRVASQIEPENTPINVSRTVWTILAASTRKSRSRSNRKAHRLTSAKPSEPFSLPPQASRVPYRIWKHTDWRQPILLDKSGCFYQRVI